MPNKQTSALRSQIMRSIKSKGTSPEIRFKRLLKKSGFPRYSCNPKSILGKPDFVFSKEKLAVFIDGCFWHGCKKCYRGPHSNLSYWKKKLLRNKKRDVFVSRGLQRQKWKVIRIWECAVKNRPAFSILRIQRYLIKIEK